MRFTREEFDAMVDELLFRDPVSFDTLCQIAEKTLSKRVKQWCCEDSCLRGKDYENDIMQSIFLQLILKTETGFLLHPGRTGAYNNDPEGFQNWMFKVAENLKKDFAKKIRLQGSQTEEVEDIDQLRDPVYEREAEEQTERLREAFAIVINADVNIYKVLTWLAQFVLIAENDITKIESNHLILESFESRTLYEMYGVIMQASRRIAWIEISKSQHNRIMEALQAKRDGDVSYGDTTYSEFFMKKNGEVSGKKSISDWVNRMNDLIKKTLNPKAESPKREKDKNTERSEKVKRMDDDGTSHN